MRRVSSSNMRVIYEDARLHDYPVARATPYSAGYDLRACIDQELVLYPGETTLISSGLRIDLRSFAPQWNLAALVLPRSGLGHKNGIILGNSIGLIDADYQDIIKVSLYNRSNTAYKIQAMDRIAQLVILPILLPALQVVESFADLSDRGGFGSTGVE